jgi:hypothetical protein
MTDLGNPLAGFCFLDELIRLLQVCGDRFFDKHVDSRLHEPAGDIEVVHCGHGHRCGLKFTVCREQLIEGAERATAELASDGIGAGYVTIDYPEQANGFSLLLELFVDTRVIAAEGSHADNGDVHDLI